MDYFKSLLDLLKIERAEDRDAYLKQTTSTSVTDRRAIGLCWYPIAITGTEPGRGDYINVEIERKSNLDIVHKLIAAYVRSLQATVAFRLFFSSHAGV